MKTTMLARLALSCAVLLSWAWLTIAAESREQKAIAENRDMDRQILQAFESRDARRMLEFFWKNPNLVVIGTGGEIAVGWETLRPIEERFYSGLEFAKAEVVEDLKVVSQDGVWSILTIKGTIRPRGGTDLHLRARIVDLRRRVAGKWVITFSHNHELPLT